MFRTDLQELIDACAAYRIPRSSFRLQRPNTAAAAGALTMLSTVRDTDLYKWFATAPTEYL